jgi:hypothetical protein
MFLWSYSLQAIVTSLNIPKYPLISLKFPYLFILIANSPFSSI